MSQPRTVNGCPVVRETPILTLIRHPQGWMLYIGGWRAGIFATEAGAMRRFDREAAAEEARACAPAAR
jgi:hypothetical protein